MIEVVPASPAHVGTIATRMAEIDQRECLINDRSPKEALRHALRHSISAYTVKIDGRPEAMFGVLTTSLATGEGSPWLLLTDVGHRQHKALVRLGYRYTRAIAEHFTMLHNRVHADNHTAIRWLARLGFAIGPVDVVNGQPVRKFALCAIPSQP